MYDDAKRFWNAWGFPFSCKVSRYASLVRQYDSTTVRQYDSELEDDKRCR